MKFCIPSRSAALTRIDSYEKVLEKIEWQWQMSDKRHFYEWKSPTKRNPSSLFALAARAIRKQQFICMSIEACDYLKARIAQDPHNFEILESIEPLGQFIDREFINPILGQADRDVLRYIVDLFKNGQKY